ncbi:hypothetical protein JCM24511_01421 [Saitozyma sp. JCM 24511]|nr:hypothetical protein JCM24511_01421 [Saitozyma sp. JCM 24511]
MVGAPSLPAELAGGIPASAAHALSFLFTTSYVGSIYLSNLFSRPGPSPRRSDRPPATSTDKRSAGQGGGVSSSLSPEPAATPSITRRSGYGNSTADEKTSAYPTAHDHAQTHHSHPHPALPPIQSTDADSHPEDFSTTPGSSGSVTPLGTGTGTSSAISTPASRDVAGGDVSNLDFEQLDGHEHEHAHEHEHEHRHHQHHAHGPKPGDRDHPETIKRRMTAVGLATAGSILGVWIVVKHVGGYTARQSIRPTLILLGIPTALPSLPATHLPSLAHAALPYLLAPTLLLGPLYAMWLDGTLPLQGYGSLTHRIKGHWASWGLVDMRNYVVGPLTEELVFRSTILAVSSLARLSLASLVLATPLWFGVAHAHHAWEVYRKSERGRAAAIRALAGCAFQLTYTTLFGWFAAYLFLRTRSVLPPLAAHVYCNIMGIYLPGTAIRRYPSKRIAIWASYLAGIAGFVFGLTRL